MKRIEFLKSLIVAPVAISQIDFSTPILDVEWLKENLFQDGSKIYCKYIKDSTSVWDRWTGATWEAFFIVFKKDCIEVTTQLSSGKEVQMFTDFKQVKQHYEKWNTKRREETQKQFFKYIRKNHA